MAVPAATRSNPFTTAIHGLTAVADPAALLDLHGTILFVNEAWDRFALENGGGEACQAAGLVGTRLLSHVSGEEPRRIVGAFLEEAARRAGVVGARPLVQTSECNSPGVARLVATRYEPVWAGPGVLVGLAAVHRTLRTRPTAEVLPAAEEGVTAWRGADGLYDQCTCCRCTRRPGEEETWDFVPGLVALAQPGTRFVYCPRCRALHVPAEELRLPSP